MLCDELFVAWDNEVCDNDVDVVAWDAPHGVSDDT